MTKRMVLVAALAAFGLSGCGENGGEAKRYQAPKKIVPMSSEVELTAKGKAMPQVAVIPTRIKFDQNDFSLSSNASHAECVMQNELFTARFKASKTINLPSFGKATPPMSVSCDVGGRHLGRTVEMVNLTKQAYQTEAASHMLIGFGLIGAAVSAGSASSRDQSKDLYGYPMQIELSTRDLEKG